MKQSGKFKHHHAKAGQAFDRGDKQQAMHHVGHMLTALRTGNDAMAPEPVAAPGAPTDAAPAFGGMRGRLGAMKK